MDPSLLSSTSKTGNDWLDSILRNPLKSGGPSVGSGFTGAMSDGSPVPGTSLATTTPALEGTVEGGATSAGNWSKILNGVGRYSGFALPATIAAAPALQGPNAFGGDVQTQMNNAKASDDADRNQLWNGVNTVKHWFGGGNTAPATAAAPAAQYPPSTLTQSQRQPPPPNPPTDIGNQGPKTPLPPPINLPIDTAYSRPTPPRRPGAPNLGYGVPQQPAAAQQAPSPMFTTIDRPNADVAGGRSVAGQLAPQYFNQAREPGGPARMGALDLSGLFSHPAVAQAAAQHPAVQGAMAAGPNMSSGGGQATARAPVVQPGRFNAGKFFRNPANWQYPNMPF